MRLLIYFSALLLMGFANPTLAEQELHYVGIYEGATKTAGRIHGPEARVILDRNGAEVTLVLASYDPVRWMIKQQEGTGLTKIVLAGRGADKSEVLLNGETTTFETKPDVPYVYETQGENFRDIVDNLPQMMGVERIASFQGKYTAPSDGFLVNSVNKENRNLKPDHLEGLTVDKDSLPESLRDLTNLESAKAMSTVTFDRDGFTVRNEDGSRQQYSVSLDVQGISWPVAGTMDPKTGDLYGVTLDGEGLLYKFSPSENQWSIVQSMANFDASGMIFDAEKRRLIVAGNDLSRGPALQIIELEGLANTVVPLALELLPGYSDLFDPGNGPIAGLVPVAVADDKLLIWAGNGRSFGSSEIRTDAVSRMWMLDLSNQSSALVGVYP